MCNVVPMERKRLLTLSLLLMDACDEYPHNLLYFSCQSHQLRSTSGLFLVHTARSSIWDLAIVLSFVMRADLSGVVLFGIFLCVSTCYFYIKERMLVKTV